MQHSVPQSRSARLHRMRVAGNTLEASCCRTCRLRCAQRRQRSLRCAHPLSAGRRRRMGARVRCLAPNMGRTIVGNGDVGRGDPGAIGGRRERREQPSLPQPPVPRPRSWMTPGDGPQRPRVAKPSRGQRNRAQPPAPTAPPPFIFKYPKYFKYQRTNEFVVLKNKNKFALEGSRVPAATDPARAS
jgi:hypothetical protein